ncbi:hypothetical protein [Enterobacter roggenkampii]|uniref:hypothetical protein n=1 Tax=Enterobacter roggenkampii TaxID=1812935 RepID=UPI0032AEF9DB
MSTITKQWLQQKIAEMEAARDEIPFGLDEDDSNTLDAMRIALASLEAEPVGYVDAEYAELLKSGHIESCSAYAEPGEGCITLYTAHPAPVSVPDEMDLMTSHLDGVTETYADGWNACRAAMLNRECVDHVDGVLPTTIQTAPALDSSPKNAESASSNSPLIPEGG